MRAVNVNNCYICRSSSSHKVIYAAFRMEVLLEQ